MSDDRHVSMASGDQSLNFGCSIKQLKREMDAAMDRLNLHHTHGQGSAWGRGRPRRKLFSNHHPHRPEAEA